VNGALAEVAKRDPEVFKGLIIRFLKQKGVQASMWNIAYNGLLFSIYESAVSFDSAHGRSFGAYCLQRMGWQLREDMRRETHTISQPVHSGRKANMLRNLRAEHPSASEQELRDRLEAHYGPLGNQTWATVNSVATATATPTSLNTPIGDGDDSGSGSELGDMIADEAADDSRGEFIRELEAIRSILRGETPATAQLKLTLGLADRARGRWSVDPCMVGELYIVDRIGKAVDYADVLGTSAGEVMKVLKSIFLEIARLFRQAEDQDRRLADYVESGKCVEQDLSRDGFLFGMFEPQVCGPEYEHTLDRLRDQVLDARDVRLLAEATAAAARLQEKKEAETLFSDLDDPDIFSVSFDLSKAVPIFPRPNEVD